MFKYLHIRLTPELALRIGLAGVFLYAGVNSLLNPTAWLGFVPQRIEVIPFLSRELALTIHGAFEILLALILLIGLWKRLAATLAFLSLAGIIIFYGIDDISFRDFGLLMAAYALMLLVRPTRGEQL